MSDRCPTCGQPVRVQAGIEKGPCCTNYYAAVMPDEVRDLIVAVRLRPHDNVVNEHIEAVQAAYGVGS